MFIYFTILVFAICTSLYGNFCVFQKKGLVADVIGHSIFPAVLLSLIFNPTKSYFWMLFLALVFSNLSFWILGYLKTNKFLDVPSIMAVLLSGFFGLGSILVSVLKTKPDFNLSGISNIFYGNISALSSLELKIIFCVSILFLVIYIFLRRYLLLISFDRIYTFFSFDKAYFIDRIFYFILTILVTLAINLVGIVLTTALFVIPCLIANFYTFKFLKLEIFSLLFSITACCLGVWISSNYNGLPTGPIIVLILGFFLLVSLFYSFNLKRS